MVAGDNNRSIFVYAHWVGMKDPFYMGVLRSEYARGKEIFSFSYSDIWLKSGYSQILDPELQLYPGSQYARDEKLNFGFFLDSSPDRWGRLLMKRREAALARSEIRSERNLRESDYLLGVFDGHRMGALIFVRYGGPQFIPEHTHVAEFLAAHVAQLCEHGHLVTRLLRLEGERQLERLQDDFVATISHELRTPLGFIKGYATTLLREDTTWDEETRREFLTIIDDEADRLRELIDNLLDSSRLQSGTLHMEFQPIRLDAMLHDISIRARSFTDNLTIKLNLEVPDLLVQADPTRLAQVFDNLLNNAAKYAPGSTVTISLMGEENRAHIAFSDTGPGISPAHLENIFSRFYRVPNPNSSVRGTGLGLFICRRIIRAHNGEITAESTLGEGTTFHIYLPYERSGRSETLPKQ